MKNFFYLVLSALFIVTSYLSLTIFTSLMENVQLPFLTMHESSWMQFLWVFYIAAAMFVINLFYLLLWKFMKVSRCTKLLPIITLIILCWDLIIDDSLGMEMQYVWSAVSALAIVLSVVFTGKDLLRK